VCDGENKSDAGRLRMGNEDDERRKGDLAVKSGERRTEFFNVVEDERGRIEDGSLVEDVNEE
jgi:hypothetical protein